MSDFADRADSIIDAAVVRGLADVRARSPLSPKGACHFCDQDLAGAARFCDADCRDDFEKEQAARRRAGASYLPRPDE